MLTCPIYSDEEYADCSEMDHYEFLKTEGTREAVCFPVYSDYL